MLKPYLSALSAFNNRLGRLSFSGSGYIRAKAEAMADHNGTIRLRFRTQIKGVIRTMAKSSGCFARSLTNGLSTRKTN
jgi:hypothetical protein